MITMKQFIELIDYHVTEGSRYCWDCFGPDAYILDSWDGDHDGASFTVIHDTKTHVVYEAQIHDYRNNRAYRMINPAFKDQVTAEASARDVIRDQAWDDVNYVDLETLEDFMEKALAVKSGEVYDTRVQLPITFSDEELLKYMKMAHEQDMTFNQFVEQALTHLIKEVEAGRYTQEDAQNFLDDDYSEI